MQKELPERKKIRLEGHDYSTNGAYFITLCVENRHDLLGQIVGATVPGRPQTIQTVELSEIGKVIDAAISHNNRNGVSIPKYIIMPNHIHMIVILDRGTGDRGRSPLQMIMRNMKAYITKQIGFSLWQKSFHDHIIRDNDEYQRIWQYIEENPLKWEDDRYYRG